MFKNRALMAVLTFLSFYFYTEFNFLLTTLVFGLIYFHEKGHAAMLDHLRLEHSGVNFIPFFGGAVIPKKVYTTAIDDASVSISGPLAGFAFCVVMAAIAVWEHNGFFMKMVAITLALHLINLFPLSVLDGGRILKSCLVYFGEWTKYLSLLVNVALGMTLYYYSHSWLFLLLISFGLLQFWAVSYSKMVEEPMASWQSIGFVAATIGLAAAHYALIIFLIDLITLLPALS